jgi:hypothetical protein
LALVELQLQVEMFVVDLAGIPYSAPLPLLVEEAAVPNLIALLLIHKA